MPPQPVTLMSAMPDLPLRAGFSPRRWQTEALAAVRPHWIAGARPVINVCTGAGKGDFIAGILVRAAVREHWLAQRESRPVRPAVVIVHRQELVRDLHARAEAVGAMHGIEVGIIMGARCDAGAPALVCSVASMSAERLAHLPGGACLLLIDEAHHATAASYAQILADLRGKVALGRPMYTLGLTATAFRHDEAGLGRVFDCVAYEYAMQSAVADGVLARPIFVTPRLSAVGGTEAENRDQRSPARIEAAVQEWLARAPGRQTIAFCTNVTHAGLLAARFRAAGIEAASVAASDGKTAVAEKLAAYRAGAIRVLCSVALVLEGFDAPATSCLLVCRAMKSPIDRRQALGRGLRSAPEKVDCICIDMTGGVMGDWGLSQEAELRDGEGEATSSSAPRALVLEVGAHVRLRSAPEWAAGTIDGEPERGRWPVRWPRGDTGGPHAGLRILHRAAELTLVSAEDAALAQVRIERRGDAQVTMLTGPSPSLWPWYSEGLGDAASWSTGGRALSGADVTVLAVPVSAGWSLWRIETPAGGAPSARFVDAEWPVEGGGARSTYPLRIDAMRAGEAVLARAGAAPRAPGDWVTAPTAPDTRERLRALGAREIPPAQGAAAMLCRALSALAARAEHMHANARAHVARTATPPSRRAELMAVAARLGVAPAVGLSEASIAAQVRALRAAWQGYLRAGTDAAAEAQWGERLAALGVARAESVRRAGGVGQAVRDAGVLLGVEA